MQNEACNSDIPVTQEAAAGASIYSKWLLALYDLEVLKFEMPVVFKCPLKRVVSLYRDNLSGVHLDVGVGTGYFLDTCKFPVENPTLHLMDLNENSLEVTASRVNRYNPVVHHWNVLESIEIELPQFASISASNFLHCLPGNMTDKEAFLRNLTPLLRDGGTFFGTTVLGKGTNAGWLFKKVNALYNRLSIFSNLEDDVQGLEEILLRHFRHVSVELVGSIALFKGVK